LRKKTAIEKLNQLEKEYQQIEFKLNTLNVQYEKMLSDYKVCYSALEASQKRIKELTESNEQLAAEAEALRANNAKLCEGMEAIREAEAAAEAVAEDIAPAEMLAAEEQPEGEESVTVAAEPAAPVKAAKEKKEVKVSEIEKFGASVIGGVVVEATRIIGDLAARSGPNTKDTLTLVLGRTEVLKSEVLAVVRDEALEDDEKKQRIIACREQAMEYLASAAAQN